jgi:GT2 family glycosyltransferase
MTLFGWRQVFIPAARGWHDRSTTKDVSRGMRDHLRRRHARAAITPAKRRLDWANVRFTIIKNDHILNVLRDLPWILGRELLVQAYFLLYEPRTLLAWGRFLRSVPVMLRRRRTVMRRARLSAVQMHRFFR